MQLRVGSPSRRAGAQSLGLLERWYAAQPVVRVAGCVLELESPVDEQALGAALERLRAQHAPALDVTLAETDGGELRFAPANGAPLPVEIDASPETWETAARQLEVPFPEGALLWRVRVVAGRRAVVAVFHHVIADGMSTAVFARGLLAALRGGGAAGPVEARVPLEERLDVRPSLRLFLREAARSVRRPAISDFRGPREDRGPLRTRLHPFEIGESVVRALTARSRAAQATVHTALSGAGLVAAAALHGLPLEARLATPISLRSRLSPAPAGMGVFICGHDSDRLVTAGTRFWSLAKSYRDELTGALPEAYERVGLSRFAGDLRKLATKIAGEHPNARTGTLEVSNLGRQDGLGGANVWFIQGNHYHGPLYNVTAGTCAETEVLRATLAVADRLVDEGTANAFVRHVTRTLERVASSDATFGELVQSLRA